jgi:hypothetical protein
VVVKQGLYAEAFRVPEVVVAVEGVVEAGS